MFEPTPLHRALAAHLGQTLTPEVAAAIAGEYEDASHHPAEFGSEQVGDYTIQAERFADILPELHALHEAHWLETEKHRHGLPLAPDYEAMAEDERAGRMLQFTVRRTGELCGNLRMYLGTSRHSGTLFATEDTLFILPAHRGGPLAMRLLKFAERALRSIGVREIRADSKLVNRADVLMRRMGYEPVALKFVKVFPQETQ